MKKPKLRKPKKLIAFQPSEGMSDALKEAARKEGLSMSDIIRRFNREGLERLGIGKPL